MNVDKIDIEKIRDIPDILPEERDIYSMLYEELSAPAHDTRGRGRPRASRRIARAVEPEPEPNASSSSSQSGRDTSDEEMDRGSSDDA